MTETKHTLDELIERLEKATGPDRLLDAMIVVELNLRNDLWFEEGELWIEKTQHEPIIRVNLIGRRSAGNPPYGDYLRYTASIDAALTLVPPHSDVRMATCHKGVVGGHAWVSTLRNSHMSFPEIFGQFLSTPDDRKPLPLALCIAALKARAAMNVARAAIAKATG